MAEPQTSGRNWVKALQKRGWELMRTKGSHHYMRHPDTGDLVSIPCHGNIPLRRSIVQKLERMTGLSPVEVKELS